MDQKIGERVRRWKYVLTHEQIWPKRHHVAVKRVNQASIMCMWQLLSDHAHPCGQCNTMRRWWETSVGTPCTLFLFPLAGFDVLQKP